MEEGVEKRTTYIYNANMQGVYNMYIRFVIKVYNFCKIIKVLVICAVCYIVTA